MKTTIRWWLSNRTKWKRPVSSTSTTRRLELNYIFPRSVTNTKCLMLMMTRHPPDWIMVFFKKDKGITNTVFDSLSILFDWNVPHFINSIIIAIFSYWIIQVLTICMCKTNLIFNHCICWGNRLKVVLNVWVKWPDNYPLVCVMYKAVRVEVKLEWGFPGNSMNLPSSYHDWFYRFQDMLGCNHFVYLRKCTFMHCTAVLNHTTWSLRKDDLIYWQIYTNLGLSCLKLFKETYTVYLSPFSEPSINVYSCPIWASHSETFCVTTIQLTFYHN